MHKPPIKQTIQQLYSAGHSIREISRILNLARNTIRSTLRQNVTSVSTVNEGSSTEAESTLIELITPLLKPCKGNLVRVREILAEEHQQNIAYSTLTRLVREYQLRETPSKRFGEYVFEPGVEMQHDTSPHNVVINGKATKAQCASLIFGFSRMLYIQYYPCFTRFEAKVFLSEALSFMQGSCQRCVIDNTSVILAGGAGQYAVIAPEMLFFSRIFGFEFMAHAVNDPNRKGKIERPFYFVETNFLAGRTFHDWTDLNRQAKNWCEQVANRKTKRALGISPESAYLQEAPHCAPLPTVLPPIYNHLRRTVNSEGFISVETHRYSIPESLIGCPVDVYQYINRIEVFHQHKKIAAHTRLTGKPYQRATDKAHHPSLRRSLKQKDMSEAERQLIGITPTLDRYLQQLKSHVRGRGGSAYKQLLAFKQLYPTDPFMAAITSAERYRLYDMNRLETIILRFISSDFFNF